MFSKDTDRLKTLLKSIVDGFFHMYQSLKLNHSIVIDEKKINLKNEVVKRISLDYGVNYYFAFISALFAYREKLFEVVGETGSDFLDNLKELNPFKFENRIKNINSISSKIYSYITKKNEKGDVPIIKCLNDLYGARIILRKYKLADVYATLDLLKKENNWIFRITNASKDGYKAIHVYVYENNFTLPWEIQFWIESDEKKNRESHAKHKQSYTSWENKYVAGEMFEVIRNE